MLSKSFKAAKCKTSLKLAAARMKLLKQKKEQQLKQMKRELAQLLQTGQEQNARIRVESFVKEEKTVAAYNFVELYCELIAGRLPIIESQKNCPIDLKEAITSVIYASPRCADIPELQDVCKQFIAKYGKDFINSALELRPDCGVNHLVIEKLSTRTPDAETKIKILSMIAQEHNVKWEPAASKEQLLKPPEDLLNGPHNFTSGSKFRMESPNGHFGPPPSQKHEPSAKSFDNGVKSPPSSRSFSSSNTNSPTFSMPIASHPESRTSSIKERKSGVEEFRYSFSKHGNASLKKKNWNMEFKDAASAAQAAAECAEMASVAARAAAELSNHGYVTRQSSTESHGSSFHGSTNEVTRRSTSSKSIGESLPTTLTPAVNSRSLGNSISFQPNTLVEQPSEPHPQTRNSACKESNKSKANFAVENRSKTLPKSVVSGSSGMSKPLGVGGNSTSREGSLKNPSHVHPKLPDYDTLAAQFKALRTNQRSL